MPLRQYIEKRKGPSGAATVEILPKTIKITYDDDGKTYEIDRLNAPDSVRDGHFIVSLDDQKERMFEPKPIGGKDVTFPAKYIGMYHAKDQMPTPKVAEGYTTEWIDQKTESLRSRTYPASRCFDLIFKILAGTYKGMEVSYRVRYLFREFEDTNEAMVWAEGGRPWDGWARELINTIQICGFDSVTDTIPYSQDGVPTLKYLDELFKSRRRVVRLHVSATGWINKVSPGDEGMTIEAYEKPDVPVAPVVVPAAPAAVPSPTDFVLEQE